MANHKPGDIIRWRGRSSGPQKEGVVEAIVAAGESIEIPMMEAMLALGPTAPRKGEKAWFRASTSMHERYLVRVAREGRGPHWYAPNTGMVDLEMASERSSS